MKKLNIEKLTEGIALLPEVVNSMEENAPKIQKYLRLIDLLAEDYISPEHLIIPEEEWTEVGHFILSLQGDETDNPYGIMIRQKLRNTVIVSRLKQGFSQAKALPAMSDDYI